LELELEFDLKIERSARRVFMSSEGRWGVGLSHTEEEEEEVEEEVVVVLLRR